MARRSYDRDPERKPRSAKSDGSGPKLETKALVPLQLAGQHSRQYDKPTSNFEPGASFNDREQCPFTQELENHVLSSSAGNASGDTFGQATGIPVDVSATAQASESTEPASSQR